jgi:hypothetical protein
MTNALCDLVGRLVRADLAAWQGLPPGLSVALAVGDSGLASMALELGDEHVAADMVHLDGPARAWSRDGEIVLVDAPVEPGGDGLALEVLGIFDAETIRYGTAPASERVYAGLGLAAIVQSPGAVLRHLMGFVPTTTHEYRRALRPGFVVTRHPTEDL